MPMFSIITPIFNVEKYLPKCIESIFAQTFSEFEVILVDDGSTDNSGSICDEYAAKDSRIRVIHKKNAGLVCARKTGTVEANGQYILNVDSDDFISPILLERAAKIINENNPDLIAFDYQDVSEDGDLLRKVENTIHEGLYTGDRLEKLKSTLIYDTEDSHINTGSLIYSVWSKFVKKELMTECQLAVPEQLQNGEDLAVIMPAVCKAKSIYIDKFYGYFYLQRNNSIVHSFEKRELDRICELIKFLELHTEGIPTKNIHSYAYRMILGQFAKAAKSIGSYKIFREFVEEKCANPIIAAAIMDFQQERLEIASKVVSQLMKHRCWFLFWLIYHK